MKPKRNQKADPTISHVRDRCQTPPYALNPLRPYLKPGLHLWEPAAGEGLLVAELRRLGFRVTDTDILTGQNFFETEPPEGIQVIVTNVPFSVKYLWFDHTFDLGLPFAYLCPLEVLGAASAQKQFRKHSVEVIFMDQRIDYKMPDAGWGGKGAQFPSIWLTHGLNIGREMTFARLRKPNAQRRAEMAAGVEQLAMELFA